MRSVRSLPWHAAHIVPPEIPVAGILAFILMLWLASLAAPTPANQGCTSTPANRAALLCSVHGQGFNAATR